MHSDDVDVQTSCQSSPREGFWALIFTQAQVAFNDNALRYLVTFMGLSMGLWKGRGGSFVSLLAALYSGPFILFSMMGGYFADRYSKRNVTVVIKLCEAGVMLLALAGLVFKNLPILMACIGLMGTHSAFFGPSKYGLLPEMLSEAELSWGNGVLEMGTNLAIVLGSGGGALLYQWFGGDQHWSGLLLMGLTLAGLLISLRITRVSAADPTKSFHPNFVAEIGRQMRFMRKDRLLWLALLGNIYFYFLGMLVLEDLVLYGVNTLHASALGVFYLNAALALGVGIGSYAAGYLSYGKIEYGLMPLGSVGMTFFGWLLWLEHPGMGGAAVNLALLGFFGGFFIVPVSAILQYLPAKEEKGTVLAAANLLSFVGIFAASGVYYLLSSLAHLSPLSIFLAGALMTLAASAWLIYALPESVLRLVLWAFTSIPYHVHVEGRENIPEKGGALLVSNYLTLLDSVLFMASTHRPIRLVIAQDWYERPLVKPFAQLFGAIAVSARQGPQAPPAWADALRKAGQAIESGELVCIFATGEGSGNTSLFSLDDGCTRILQSSPAPAIFPIIPVHLDNVWGGIFHVETGKFLWKWPRRFPYPVTASFGKPLPPSASPLEVRHAVQELGAAAYSRHRQWLLPLHRSFLRTARLHPLRVAMADAQAQLRFGTALLRMLFLTRRLKPVWRDQRNVGIMLPPSLAGALVNYAARLLGKVPINLNYTASEDALASCAQQCNLQTVISARVFLERAKVQPPGRTVLLEELVAKPRRSEKIAALLLALCPTGLLERLLGRARPGSAPALLDELATIIFSSGSTGQPKGVLLSEFNIAANIEQTLQAVYLKKQDALLGILPFFHAFGFTVGLWLPAVAGITVVYHPNPTDAKAIGSLVRKYQITLLVATPTFLQGYTRRCAPEDFGSLRLVFAGAEKLPQRVAAEFEEHFGKSVLEGYGCTECSPVVAANTGDFRPPDLPQIGAKPGKIGQPLAGMAVRIVDPETGQPVHLGQPGLLLVRGPNVMRGYLGLPEKTAEVLREGWYVTGDMAFEDEDGFLEITDRLSRFSKIGGEMVPHLAIESMLQQLAGAEEPAVAVTAVPDERKGERLVVLHTLTEEQLQQCLRELAHSSLPNLWKPDPRQFFRIQALPYLGIGKLNLAKVRELAVQLSYQSHARAGS